MFVKISKSVKVIYEPIMFQNDFWGYNIKIENIGDERLVVTNTYWQVPNDKGYLDRIDENCVKNLNLNPGDVCEIVGLPPLQESMQEATDASLQEDEQEEENWMVIGSYTLKKENGEEFDLHIPFFTPNQLTTSRTMH